MSNFTMKNTDRYNLTKPVEIIIMISTLLLILFFILIVIFVSLNLINLAIIFSIISSLLLLNIFTLHTFGKIRNYVTITTYFSTGKVIYKYTIKEYEDKLRLGKINPNSKIEFPKKYQNKQKNTIIDFSKDQDDTDPFASFYNK